MTAYEELVKDYWEEFGEWRKLWNEGVDLDLKGQDDLRKASLFDASAWLAAFDEVAEAHRKLDEARRIFDMLKGKYKAITILQRHGQSGKAGGG
jgi:hypothetical protein